jgi:ribosomal protein L17
MRDALMIAVNEKCPDKKLRKIRVIAEKLVELAMAGDMTAIRELNDRIDGKAPQFVDLSGHVGISHEEALKDLE